MNDKFFSYIHEKTLIERSMWRGHFHCLSKKGNRVFKEKILLSNLLTLVQKSIMLVMNPCQELSNTVSKHIISMPLGSSSFQIISTRRLICRIRTILCHVALLLTNITSTTKGSGWKASWRSEMLHRPKWYWVHWCHHT